MICFMYRFIIQHVNLYFSGVVGVSANREDGLFSTKAAYNPLIAFFFRSVVVCFITHIGIIQQNFMLRIEDDEMWIAMPCPSHF